MDGLITWIVVVVAAASCDGYHFENMGSPSASYGGNATEGPTTAPASYPQNIGHTGNTGNSLHYSDVNSTTTGTGVSGNNSGNPNQKFLESFFKLLLTKSANGATTQSSGLSLNKMNRNAFANSLNQLNSGDILHGSNSANIPVPTSNNKESMTKSIIHVFQNRLLAQKSSLNNNGINANSNTFTDIYNSEAQQQPGTTNQAYESTTLAQVAYKSPITSEGVPPPTGKSSVYESSFSSGNVMKTLNDTTQYPTVDVKTLPNKTYPESNLYPLANESVVNTNQSYDNQTYPQKGEITPEQQTTLKPKPYKIQTKSVLPKENIYIQDHKTTTVVELSGTLSSKSNLLNVLSTANQHDQVQGTTKVVKSYKSVIPPNQPSPRLYPSFPHMLPASYAGYANVQPQNDTNTSASTIGDVYIAKTGSTININGVQSSKVNKQITNSNTVGSISYKPYIGNKETSLKAYQTDIVQTTMIPKVYKKALSPYTDTSSMTDKYVSNHLNQPRNVQMSMSGVKAGSASTQMIMPVQNQPSGLYQANEMSITSKVSNKHKTKQANPAVYPLETSTNVNTFQGKVVKKPYSPTTSSYNPALAQLAQLTKASYSREATEQYLMILSWFVETLLQSLNVSVPKQTYSQTNTPSTPTTTTTTPSPIAKYPAYPNTHAPNIYNNVPYPRPELPAITNAPIAYNNLPYEQPAQINGGMQGGGGSAQAGNAWLYNNGLETQGTGFNGAMNQNQYPYAGQGQGQGQGQAGTYQNQGVTNNYQQQTGTVGMTTTQTYGRKACSLSRVCGSDGRNYLSPCFIPTGTIKACDGACPCPSLPVAPSPPQYVPNHAIGQSQTTTSMQEHGNQGYQTTAAAQGSYTSNNATVAACIAACPNIDQPVCSSLAKTYRSDCHLRCSNATKMCNTFCPCEYEEILPGMRRTLVSIDELLAANHGVGQNPYDMLVPKTPQCTCPPLGAHTIFVCTRTGQTLSSCQAQCLRSPLQCYQRCPCTIEW